MCGEKVLVITGDEKGQTGTVTQIRKKDNRRKIVPYGKYRRTYYGPYAIVEGLDLPKRNNKPEREGRKGKMIHISNLKRLVYERTAFGVKIPIEFKGKESPPEEKKQEAMPEPA